MGSTQACCKASIERERKKGGHEHRHRLPLREDEEEEEKQEVEEGKGEKKRKPLTSPLPPCRHLPIRSTIPKSQPKPDPILLSILGFHPAEDLLQETFQEALDAFTHANGSDIVPVVDVPHQT